MNLFSQKTPAPVAAPTPTPPPTMPDPMSPATLEARRRSMADTNTGGRQSTILSTAGSRAGASSTLAGSYGATKAGG